MSLTAPLDELFWAHLVLRVMVGKKVRDRGTPRENQQAYQQQG